MSASPQREANCKGSWSLGSACGECERCRDEAVKMMPGALAAIAQLERVKVLVAVSRNASPALREAVHAELVEVLK